MAKSQSDTAIVDELFEEALAQPGARQKFHEIIANKAIKAANEAATAEQSKLQKIVRNSLLATSLGFAGVFPASDAVSLIATGKPFSNNTVYSELSELGSGIAIAALISEKQSKKSDRKLVDSAKEILVNELKQQMIADQRAKRTGKEGLGRG